MSDEIVNNWPLTIDDAVNKAAKHLPKGYVISINIEKGGYGVVMTNPDGSEVGDLDGGDGLISDVNEGICIANGFTSL